MCNPWPACGLVKGFLKPSKDVFIVYVQYTVANRRGGWVGHEPPDFRLACRLPPPPVFYFLLSSFG